MSAIRNSQIAKWDNSGLRDSYMLYPRKESTISLSASRSQMHRQNLINYVSNPNFVLLRIFLHNDTISRNIAGPA